MAWYGLVGLGFSGKENQAMYNPREQKLRRALNKAGYSLHKSRIRNIHLDNLGGIVYLTAPFFFEQFNLHDA